jgi:predicted aspartyl protease
VPSIFGQIQNMRVTGPVMPVRIELPTKAKEILTKNKQAIPSPVTVFGLIDTGATGTCISDKVCQDLKLQPDGAIRMLTAGHPVYVPVYTVRVVIQTAPGRSVIIESIPVASPPLAGQANIDCLIGRDILAHAVLVYIGYANSISLSL